MTSFNKTPPLLVTSIPPSAFSEGRRGENIERAIRSFEDNGFKVVSLNRPAENCDVERFPSVEFRTATGSGLFPDRYGPTFGDLLSEIADDKFGAIVNSDIYMVKSNAAGMNFGDARRAIVARRVDVASLSGEVLGVYKNGIDGIFVSGKGVSEILDDAALCSFQLGAPYWDIVVPLALSFHNDLEFAPVPFLCHPIHEAKWNADDYHLLREAAVKAIVNHAKKYEAVNDKARSFLLRLEDFLDSEKVASPLEREKRTAEFMGCWIANYESSLAQDLRLEFSDRVIARSARGLFDISAEALTMAKLFDSNNYGRVESLKLVFKAFRRSFRKRKSIDKVQRYINV